MKLDAATASIPSDSSREMGFLGDSMAPTKTQGSGATLSWASEKGSCASILGALAGLLEGSGYLNPTAPLDHLLMSPTEIMAKRLPRVLWCFIGRMIPSIHSQSILSCSRFHPA